MTHRSVHQSFNLSFTVIMLFRRSCGRILGCFRQGDFHLFKSQTQLLNSLYSHTRLSRVLKRHCSAVLIRNPAERQSLTAVLANSVKSTVEYMQNSSYIVFEIYAALNVIVNDFIQRVNFIQCRKIEFTSDAPRQDLLDVCCTSHSRRSQVCRPLYMNDTSLES